MSGRAAGDTTSRSRGKTLIPLVLGPSPGGFQTWAELYPWTQITSTAGLGCRRDEKRSNSWHKVPFLHSSSRIFVHSAKSLCIARPSAFIMGAVPEQQVLVR